MSQAAADAMADRLMAGLDDTKHSARPGTRLGTRDIDHHRDRTFMASRMSFPVRPMEDRRWERTRSGSMQFAPVQPPPAAGSKAAAALAIGLYAAKLIHDIRYGGG